MRDILFEPEARKAGNMPVGVVMVVPGIKISVENCFNGEKDCIFIKPIEV